MSNSMGLGGLAGVAISKNALQAASMFSYIDKSVRENADKELDGVAEDLEKKMKSNISTGQAGLTANTAFTIDMKGNTTPLLDSEQLVKAITTVKYGEGEAKLPKDRTNTFSAIFVGITKNPVVRMSASQIGDFTPVYMHTIALNMVKGYSVVLPNGLVKKVPRRDFRTKCYNEIKDDFQERLGSAVAYSYRSLGNY